jgi:hypothetical protein
MTLKLNRNKLFTLGLFIIVIFLSINRLNRFIGAGFTEGQVVEIIKSSNRISYNSYDNSYDRLNAQTNYNFPIIQFSTKSLSFKFQDISNSNVKIGEKVKVIYKKNNPENAEVFTFWGFLFSPILYCLIPLLVLAAAVYSFLSKSEFIEITLEKNFKINKK